MEYQPCPFCGLLRSDLLTHLRMIHDIKDVNQYQIHLKKQEILERKKVLFANYVEEQQIRMKNNEITSEKYRELITEWVHHNKNDI